MKALFPIAALAAAALVSSAANADTVHRHHRAGAGLTHRTSMPAPIPAPMPAPTEFQGLYGGDGYAGSGYPGYSSDPCEGQRVFGFCPVR